MSNNFAGLFGNSMDEDTKFSKLSNLVMELNDPDKINFDIRFALDMPIAITLDEIENYCKMLGLDGAIKEIEKLKHDMKLLAFADKREKVFNNEDSELCIIANDISEAVDMEVLVREILGDR